MWLAATAVAVLPTTVGAIGDNGGVKGDYAMTGLVAGQVARLSVANVAAPPIGPTNPCHVELSFVDTQGHVFSTGDGPGSLTQVTIPPSGAAWLDLPAPGSAFGFGNRLALRPVVRPLSPQPAADCAPVASIDIFDSVSGLTKVGTPPDRPPPPPPRARLRALAWSAWPAGRPARFSVVAQPADPTLPGDPMRGSRWWLAGPDTPRCRAPARLRFDWVALEPITVWPFAST